MAVTGGRRREARRSGRIDWRAVADGAVVSVVVTLAPTLVVRFLKRSDLDGQESNLWVVAVVALLVGFALGGRRAARRRMDAPLLHAAASAAAAFVPLTALAVIRAVFVGKGLTVPLVVTLLLLLQITVSMAVIGGYLAMRSESMASRRIGAAAAPPPGPPDRHDPQEDQ
jgi:hypothetical protein